MLTFEVPHPITISPPSPAASWPFLSVDLARLVRCPHLVIILMSTASVCPQTWRVSGLLRSEVTMRQVKCFVRKTQGHNAEATKGKIMHYSSKDYYYGSTVFMRRSSSAGLLQECELYKVNSDLRKKKRKEIIYICIFIHIYIYVHTHT